MTNPLCKTRARSTTTRLFRSLTGLALVTAAAGCSANSDEPPQGQAPSSISGLRLTWFSISNWSLQTSDVHIVIDGYMTRIPPSYFAGGGGQLGLTKKAYPIDKQAVDKMLDLLTADRPVTYLLTGHSHFDHTFDTPYWAKKTGAKIIGSQTTCFQAQALGIPKEQCSAVHGGESFQLSPTVNMWVVLWNHSGTHEANPEQHDPVELVAPPVPDMDGNLRGGVAEDFPNGGGNRGYLFKIVTPDKTLSMFWTNSGAPQDLQLDTVVNGVNYGSPLRSLSKAMSAAGLSSVDLWIGGGVEPVARFVVPILNPAVYIPNHLGDLFQWFERGYDNGPFVDPVLSKYLPSVGCKLLLPVQFLDRFDLTSSGVKLVENQSQKMAYGFNDTPVYRAAGVPPQSDAGPPSTGGTPEAGSALDSGVPDATLLPEAGNALDTGASADAPLDVVVSSDAARDAGGQ